MEGGSETLAITPGFLLRAEFSSGHCRPPESASLEQLGGHSPLVGEQVKLPVELAHCDGLGVEHIVVDSFIHTATNGWLPFQRRHGSRQDSVTLWSHHQKVNPLASQRAGRQRPMGYRWRLMPLLETPSQALCLHYSCQSLWAQQA